MSCYNPDGTGIFTNSTPVPALYPNGTEYHPYKYSQFLESLNLDASCGGATYLRPDVGGALLPWLYTVFAILIHLPVAVIRVARWERVQILSLALAAFTIVLTVQSYTSTGLAPDKILVWMPLTLPLDAGSMLQLFALIVEDEKGFSKLRDGLFQIFNFRSRTNGYKTPGDDTRDADDDAQDSGDDGIKALVAMGAITLFLIIVSLQILGIVHATKGRSKADDLTVAWCSPIFELFTIAVSDGNCNLYPVAQNSGKGLGCVYLPAARQKNWSLAVPIFGSVALMFEFFDFLILCLVNSGTKWRNLKLRRPWFTVRLPNSYHFKIAIFND
jgi:hypothetical protein